MPPQTPILLLKTKSSPHDGYEDYFSTNGYTPSFIPVLEHRFHTENLASVRELFASGAFNTDTTTTTPDNGSKEASVCKKKYGGMIFTSQRAVEAFAEMIEQKGLPFHPSQSTPLPLYTVGPATARALAPLRDTYLPTATIHGADAGNGHNLAHLILDHYNALQLQLQLQLRLQQDRPSDADADLGSHKPKPSLLFLVGEQRRDIIPKTLMDTGRPAAERIDVDEIVVYETGEMGSFEVDFRDVLRRERQGAGGGPIWVVVFSPSGCEGMLRVLGLGPFKSASASVDRDGDGDGEGRRRDVFVATIGPTTRDFLRERFGFEADVCAERPSPEGIAEGIRRFVDGSGE